MSRFRLGAVAGSLMGMFAGVTVLAQGKIEDALKAEHAAQTGTCITIIFDDSGSMAGKKIAQAKSAFGWWLAQVPDDYRLSLVTFKGGGSAVIPLGKVAKSDVAAKVGALQAKAGTPICRSLAIAHAQIKKRRQEVTPYERHVVVLFTDGEESVDSRRNRGVQQDVRKLRQDLIEVVGIGFHGEGDYLRGVATRFYAANDEAELKRGLSQVDAELGDISEIEVSDAELKQMASMTFEAPSASEGAPAPQVEKKPLTPQPPKVAVRPTTHRPATRPVGTTRRRGTDGVGSTGTIIAVLIVGAAIAAVALGGRSSKRRRTR